jgi:Leucine-rich repeat (LRR) protein
MRRIELQLCLCWLFLGLTGNANGQDNLTERRAVLELQAMGATYVEDKENKVFTVVELDLAPVKNSHKSEDYVPIRQLKNLRKIRMMGVQFDDACLKHLSMLSSLESVRLVQTKIGDKGLAHLSGLKKLRELCLACSYDITDSGIQTLTELKGIENLELTWTKVTDSSMPMIAKLSKIRDLDLTGSRVTDQGIGALIACKELKTIDLSNTEVTDKCLKSLGGLPKLKELNLSYTRVSKEAVANFCKLRPDVHISTDP